MHYGKQDDRRGVYVIRRGPLTQAATVEMPQHRIQAIILFVMLVVLTVLGIYLYVHTDQVFRRFEAKAGAATGDSVKLRRYSTQVESLQDKMTGFIADSVENKLRLIEKSIASGSVGTAEIREFEELKSQLRLLESYTAGRSGDLTDGARLDHPRLQMTPGSAAISGNGDLFPEMLELKRLVYFSIASCGVMAMMISGYWWQHTIRFRRLASDHANLRLLIQDSEHRD